MPGMSEPYDDAQSLREASLEDVGRSLNTPIEDPIAVAQEAEARQRLAEEQARRFAEDQARHEALHDSLTRLPNRALCIDRLGHALATTVWTRTNVAVLALAVELDRPGLG